MDRIALRGIAASGRHGANPGERDAEQRFDLDVEFDIDLRAAEHSDALSDTVDYAELHRRLVAIVAETSYELLERLAGELLQELFADERIASARLTIGKPHILNGATPSVTLVRDNPAYRSLR
ncbi:MAG: dihydroneopterin aldolase [Candidatus Eremiobacteraeota bacterium]|nr:dihydroneopterin aldolase [Candidatus Eremiobacteraeota bacterium]